MGEQRQLEDIVILNELWREETELLLGLRRSVFDQVLEYNAEFFGRQFRDQLINGQMDIDFLRQNVALTSHLDREVVGLYGSKLLDVYMGDREEATARRIAHHSGRLALDQVKSVRLRTILSVDNSRSNFTNNKTRI